MKHIYQVNKINLRHNQINLRYQNSFKTLSNNTHFQILTINRRY